VRQELEASMLILNRSEVERLLTMKECIRVMGEALAARARGETLQPPRTALRLADGSGAMLTMPAWVGTPSAFGVKVISVFPGNFRRGKESHQGAVLSIDPKTGEILALLEGGAVTAIRTAAVSAVATNLLARAEADDLAILGTGVQAASHLRAICAVRQIRRIRLWGRSRERTRQFAESTTAPAGVTIEVMPSAKAAVAGASIICTVTGSPTPVLDGDWLAEGAHLNAVGAHTPETRELDTTVMTRSRIFVDARDSALSEAGELLIPIGEGRLSKTDIQAELGEVILGTHPGRWSSGEITLFKSLGLGIEDVVAAWHVVAEARRLHVGIDLPLLA
jgi:alanine dehydrogenase